MGTLARISIFILLLTLSHTQSSDSVKILEPLVEQYFSFSGFQGSFIQYFNFTIVNKIRGADLMIMARPLDENSDPDLFISTTNKFPDKIDNSEIICTSNGLDVCTIPERNITDNLTFYVSVRCYMACNFGIKATYQSQDDLFFILQPSPENDTLSGTMNVDFSEKEAKLIRFFVPANDKNFQRILVRVQPNRPEAVNESFTFYMNEGPTPPTTSKYLFKGLEAWNSGKFVLVTNSYFEFWATNTYGSFQTSDINYTLLILAPKNITLQVKVKAYNDLVKVRIHQSVQDMVYKSEKLTYELSIDKNSSDLLRKEGSNLLFTLTAFAGNPDLYVNPDTLPSNLSQYQWKSTESGKEILILTFKEQIRIGASGLKFYVTVYGQLTSTFSLWIGSTKNTNFLDFGVSQTGIVANDEIINYRLMVYSDTDLNITATLGTESGNPDLYIKLCKISGDSTSWTKARLERLACMVSANDIKTRDRGVNSDGEFIIYSANVDGKDSLTFRHEASNCGGDSSSLVTDRCMYMIGVLGNCNWQNESQFSLVVTHSNQHILLTENDPQRMKADLGKIYYYKFSIMDDRDVEKVNFLITEISGKVTSFLSRSNPFPSELDHEKLSYSHFGELTYQSSTEGSLLGSYYLSVLSETAATYSILTNVKRNSTEKELTPALQAIRLSEGVPQFYSFKLDIKQKHYFRIKVSLQQPGDVAIHLTSIKGEFRLFVLNTKISNLTAPSRENYHFKMDSHESTLLIPKESEYWSKKARYVVLVEPILNTKNVDAGENYDFVIQYSTSLSMKGLSSYNPLTEKLKNNTYSYYRCEVHKGDESIEISLDVKSFNPYMHDVLGVYLSFRPSNPFPDVIYNDFSTTVQDSRWILVENQDLKKYCSWMFNESAQYTKQCYFYMSIGACESEAPEIVYSISIKRNRVVQPEGTEFEYVTDNAPKTLHYDPKNPETFYFLYKLEKTKRPLHITAFTQDYHYGASFSIMANFHILANLTKEQLAQNFPKMQQSAVNFVIDSEWHHSISFTIYQEKFNALTCLDQEGGCGLFISVFIKPDNESSNSTFTIQVTRKLTTLKAGVPLKGLVMDNEIKYYRLDIDEISTKVLISVTPLNDGDPDLIVNRGLNNEWPNIDRYDFGSQNTNADQVSFEHLRDNASDSANSYVVGVYGKKNCSYLLTATYGDFHFISLYEGSPSTYFLKPREKIFFKYSRSYSDGDFRIIMPKNYGEILWAMTPLNNSQDFIENLPDFNRNNYAWSNLGTKELDHFIISQNDAHYCKNCTYILVVEAEKETSFTILVSGTNQTIYLQDAKSLKDYVDEGVQNSYVSYFYEDVKIIEVNILVYSGEIDVKLFNASYFSQEYLISEKSSVKSNSITLTYEPQESLDWYYNMVAVCVIGKVSSSFTISIYGKERDRNIQPGISEYGEALPHSRSNFIYFSNTAEDSYDPYFSLTLQTTFDSGYANETNLTANQTVSIDLLSKFHLRVYSNNQTHGIVPIPTNNFRSDDYIYVRFKALKGEIIITLDNMNNKYGFSYNLIMTSSDINILHPGSLYTSYLEVQKTLYYQMMVQHEQKVLIELFQCSGRNKLIVASKQNFILNHQSDLNSEVESSLSPNHIIREYNVKNLEDLYIAVKAIEGGRTDSWNKYMYSTFILKSHWIKKGVQTPYEVFNVGNEGEIKFTKENSNFSFLLQKLTCGDKPCQKAMKKDLKNAIQYYHYGLKVSSQAELVESSVTCFLTNNNFNQTSDVKSLPERVDNQDLNGYYVWVFLAATDSLESLLQFSIDLNKVHFEANTPYYAKAFAQVYLKEANTTEKYTFFYRTTEFYADKSFVGRESGSLVWILIFVFLGFIAALFAAVLYFRKYKKTEKQLNYELQDVTKVARIDKREYFGLSTEADA